MMRKITIEEIEFIDRYLEKSGVEYLDVRAELVDHVASGLEYDLNADSDLSFYDAFKNYMVINKKIILKRNIENVTHYYHDITKRFGKSFLKLDVGLLIIISVLVKDNFAIYMNEDRYRLMNMAIMVIAVIGIAIFFRKERKVSLGANVLSFVLFPFYLTMGNPNPFVVFSYFGFFLAISYLNKTFSEQIKKVIGEQGFIALVVLIIMFLIPIVIYIGKSTNHLVTESVMMLFMSFQLITWYVMVKMLIEYKKEINHKYQTVLK